MARPIPRELPVTRAILPANRIATSSPRRVEQVRYLHRIKLLCHGAGPCFEVLQQRLQTLQPGCQGQAFVHARVALPASHAIA